MGFQILFWPILDKMLSSDYHSGFWRPTSRFRGYGPESYGGMEGGPGAERGDAKRAFQPTSRFS